MTREAGFTLVEVMVAVFIMAIVTAMGATLISDAVRTRDQVGAVTSDVEALQLARALLKRDLAQIVDRRARGPYGDPAPSAFEGGTDLDGEALMRFVRGGVETPGSGEGSRLQAVDYRFEDGALIRRTRAHVDEVPDMPVRERVLLEGIERLDVRFLTRGGWTDAWGGQAGAPGVAPLAVELALTHRRFGEIEAVFLTPEGY